MESPNMSTSTAPPNRIPLLPADRRLRQGAWLLIASLGIFFFSSMILYVVYIAMRLQDGGFEQLPLRLPASFLPSTVLLIVISALLHYASKAAVEERRVHLIQIIIAAIVCSLLFFAVQSEGMWRLIESMRVSGKGGMHAYAFTFFLALVHALHVVGGLVGLVWVLVNAIRCRYDHERHYGVTFCGLYWHFLDVVWLVMLASFATASALIQAKLSSA